MVTGDAHVWNAHSLRKSRICPGQAAMLSSVAHAHGAGSRLEVEVSGSGSYQKTGRQTRQYARLSRTRWLEARQWSLPLHEEVHP